MTLLQQAITIGLCAIATMLTRFAPFLLFSGRETPRFIQYLGKALPGAIFGMLVGMVIDTEGRFPDTDAAVFAETGERIRRVFGAPIAIGKDRETELILPEDPAAPPAYAVLREDITMGERVTGYTLRAYDREGNEIFSHSGKVISHKRILKIPAATARVKLDVTDNRDDPVLLPLEICSEG